MERFSNAYNSWNGWTAWIRGNDWTGKELLWDFINSEQVYWRKLKKTCSWTNCNRLLKTRYVLNQLWVACFVNVWNNTVKRMTRTIPLIKILLNKIWQEKLVFFQHALECNSNWHCSELNIDLRIHLSPLYNTLQATSLVTSEEWITVRKREENQL